jgi:hypothetical protein
MKERGFTLPEIGLIAGVRGLTGVGMGLLIADKFRRDQRVGAGWALLLAGTVMSIPIAVMMLRKPAVTETEAEKPMLVPA